MNINWNKFATLLLPIGLRTRTLTEFIRSALTGLVPAYNKFIDYENDVKYRMKHTSQVWSIEAVLNDTFDPVERRIYIKSTEDTEFTALFPDEEERPVVLQPDTVSVWKIHPDDGYNAGEYSFVVVFPGVVSQGTIDRASTIIDYYKLAGNFYCFEFKHKQI